MSDLDIYQSPLNSRYCSPEMKQLFSPRMRFSTWRRLWLWLAEAEAELGKKEITPEALSQMRAHLDINDEEFQLAAEEEKKRRHDVMAHVHTFGLAAPAAAAIIHWGATSCYVTDNADLIFLKQGLAILLPKLAQAIRKLADFALEQKDQVCPAYTHGQAAIPTTMGKRATLWVHDLLMDLRNLERAHDDILFRGVKGTTGTQASFLDIFGGDHDMVEELDALVSKKAGFVTPDGEPKTYPVSSQTYTRKVDVDVLSALAGLGATCERIGTDLRILAMKKQVEEPFEKHQIGSSAMAWKRNPMRSERLCSLGRKLQHFPQDALHTYSAQWLERSLDDSAIRRISLPEGYLCADACLILLNNVAAGLVVYPAVIAKELAEELPFFGTEKIINALVRKGGSRQEAHEEIRVLSHQAAEQVKLHGKDNDLIERIKANKFFEPVHAELDQLLDPKTYVGRAPQQVEKFVERDVGRALSKYAGMGAVSAELHV
jgi:adenylosuccinate lyase